MATFFCALWNTQIESMRALNQVDASLGNWVVENSKKLIRWLQGTQLEKQERVEWYRIGKKQRKELILDSMWYNTIIPIYMIVGKNCV